MICKSCKAQNKDDSIFCEVCGARLRLNNNDVSSRRRETEEFRYEFVNDTAETNEDFKESADPIKVETHKNEKPLKIKKAKKEKPPKPEKKPVNKITLATVLAVISAVLLLISVFSLLTGFGAIKNYTGLFEKETTTAETTKAVTTEPITNPIFEIATEAEQFSDITSGQ